MFYDKDPYFSTLRFDDIFESPEEFETKMSSMVMFDIAKLMPFAELYYLLALKYADSTTRYQDEYTFIIALIRELNIAYPAYKQQKLLMEEMQALEINEVRKGLQMIMNTIQNPNDPTDNPAEIPIPDLSSQQITQSQKLNALEAIKQKYYAITNDYQTKLYNRLDKLFRVILSDDTIEIFSQGEN